LKNAKKIFVIGLMAILVLSVTLSALTFYSRRTSPSIQTLSDLNSQVNAMVSGCIQALPNGTPECDSQLKEIVSQLCQQNNDSLDACKDGRVQQYYQMRRG
jgi:hypothetical protein